MNWTLWWAFAVTATLLAITPGPAVLMVLATGLRSGVWRSVGATLGILSANAMYFALSATSLGAILVASYNLFFFVKWIGAFYLAYLGIKALFSKSSLLLPAAAGKDSRVYSSAFLLQVSNPKALIFFAAILPQFLDLQFPPPRQIAILGVTSIVSEFCVLLVYGFIAGKGLAILREPRYTKWADRAAGVLLLCAGLGLAIVKK